MLGLWAVLRLASAGMLPRSALLNLAARQPETPEAGCQPSLVSSARASIRGKNFTSKITTLGHDRL